MLFSKILAHAHSVSSPLNFFSWEGSNSARFQYQEALYVALLSLLMEKTFVLAKNPIIEVGCGFESQLLNAIQHNQFINSNWRENLCPNDQKKLRSRISLTDPDPSAIQLLEISSDHCVGLSALPRFLKTKHIDQTAPLFFATDLAIFPFKRLPIVASDIAKALKAGGPGSIFMMVDELFFPADILQSTLMGIAEENPNTYVLPYLACVDGEIYVDLFDAAPPIPGVTRDAHNQSLHKYAKTFLDTDDLTYDFFKELRAKLGPPIQTHMIRTYYFSRLSDCLQKLGIEVECDSRSFCTPTHAPRQCTHSGSLNFICDVGPTQGFQMVNCHVLSAQLKQT